MSKLVEFDGQSRLADAAANAVLPAFRSLLEVAVLLAEYVEDNPECDRLIRNALAAASEGIRQMQDGEAGMAHLMPLITQERHQRKRAAELPRADLVTRAQLFKAAAKYAAENIKDAEARQRLKNGWRKGVALALNADHEKITRWDQLTRGSPSRLENAGVTEDELHDFILHWKPIESR